MPIRLIDPNCPVKWVHPIDKDDPKAMVFHIVCLTEGQSRKIANEFLGKVPNEQVVNHIQHAMFVECVKRIDNVYLPGDSSAPRSISEPEDKQQFLDCFPAQYMGPLYVAMQNVNALDEGALKNSDASPVSQPS